MMRPGTLAANATSPGPPGAVNSVMNRPPPESARPRTPKMPLAPAVIAVVFIATVWVIHANSPGSATILSPASSPISKTGSVSPVIFVFIVVTSRGCLGPRNAAVPALVACPIGVATGTFGPSITTVPGAILLGVNPVAARSGRTEPDVVAVSAVTTLFVIAFAALAIRVGWLLWHGLGEIPWDGAEYATLAQNLASGHGYLGLRGATLFVFPPFYSLTITALLPLTGDAVRAGVAVSLLSGAALVFPLYGIASIVYGRRAGYAAAVLAAVLPFAVQLSTVVLADMLFLTLAATGLFFLVRTVDAHRYTDAVAVGLAFGLAY